MFTHVNKFLRKGEKKKVIKNKNSGIENMQTYVERIKQGHIGKKKKSECGKGEKAEKKSY